MRIPEFALILSARSSGMRCVGKGRKLRRTPLRLDVAVVLKQWSSQPSDETLKADVCTRLPGGRSRNSSSVESAERKQTLFALRHGLGDSFLDHSVGNAVATQTLSHDDDGTRFAPSQIFAESLADIETDERLISAEAAPGSNLFEIVENVFRHTNADGSHRAIFLQSLFHTLIHTHRFF